MGLWAICGQFGGNMKANKEAARLGNMKIQTSRQHKFNTNMAQNAVFAICSKVKMSKNANVLNSNMAQNAILAITGLIDIVKMK